MDFSDAWWTNFEIQRMCMIKVRAENMIQFITVCGFFIGLIFCIINMHTPVDILVYTLEITLFFYLLAHVASMNFMDTKDSAQELFNNEAFEEISSYFVHEIEERENRIEALLRIEDKVEHKPKPRKKKLKRHGSPEKKAA